MKNIIAIIVLILIFTNSYSQKIKWENKTFELINTKHEIVQINGTRVLKLEQLDIFKDLKIRSVD